LDYIDACKKYEVASLNCHQGNGPSFCSGRNMVSVHFAPARKRLASASLRVWLKAAVQSSGFLIVILIFFLISPVTTGLRLRKRLRLRTESWPPLPAAPLRCCLLAGNALRRLLCGHRWCDLVHRCAGSL